MASYFSRPAVLVGGKVPGNIFKNSQEHPEVFSAKPATPAQAQAPAPTAPVSQPTPVAQPVAQPTTQAVQPPPNPQAPPPPAQATGPMVQPRAPQPQPAQPSLPTSTPAQPGSGQMSQQLWQNAVGAMNNPSRYDADLVKQGAAVIEDTIARMRKSGMRSIGENQAARGLLGSSLEQEANTNLEGQLDAQGREMLFNLQRDQASTYANDRNQAFGMGLGTAGLQEGIEGRLGNEDYRNRALSQDRYFGDRSNDRADLALTGDFADRFGPEAVPGYSNADAAPAVMGAGSAIPAGGEYGFGSIPSEAGSGSRSDPMAGGDFVGVGSPLASGGSYFGQPDAPNPYSGSVPGEEDPNNLYGAARQMYFGYGA